LTSKYDFNAILDKAEDIILKVIKKRRTSDFMTIAEAAKVVYEQIEGYVGNKSDLTGLNTGYPNLNKATLGFQKGDLMILAARPSVGKSSYAINLALNIANMNKDKHIALFSLEMSIEQLMMRIFSYQANLELSNIRSGHLASDELLLLSIAKQDLSRLNLHFDESSSTNIADIRSKCRQLKQAEQLDFVIIDYLQLITLSDSRGNRQEEVSKISRQLKTLARELDVPILALSQLSRGIETRDDKRPVLADLRESGSIEQDADLVMFLYRRSDVEDNSSDEEQGEASKKEEKAYQEVVLSIAKNRQGPIDYIDYHFYGAYSRFSEQKEKKPIIIKKRSRSVKTKKLNE
jgi:replicative DNA helicase